MDHVFNPAKTSRFLVLRDLGHVHKGDHIIVFDEFALAVDTSTLPGDPVFHGDAVRYLKPVLQALSPPNDQTPKMRKGFPVKKAKTAKKTTVGGLDVTDEQIFDVIQKHGPVRSISISDHLGFARDDLATRNKVTHGLRRLLDDKRIQRAGDDPNRLPYYEIVKEAVSLER